ncbi:magnesium/cobalt transporter CorA [Aureliella helgolandensis]|uniref:Magnesium transport protein CorA n=1 Tax=Aureliella helgolandensis TaxID=2527968 RepID=A0A518G6A9_9BACT|nr:magnesium/cobalt transporter CorA [Aureliella helgolandensis]QDV24128.1 Magnesium transport protein CorA [Aureliella helgolandensis]
MNSFRGFKKALRRRTKQNHALVGAVPGSLVQHEFAHDSRARAIEFSRLKHEDRQLESAAELQQHLAAKQHLVRMRPRRTAGSDDATEASNLEAGRLSTSPPRPVTWLNIDGLADVELLKEIGAQFGLHPLALEDVVNVGQLAKSEAYDNNLFIILRMPHVTDQFETEQVSLFLLDGLVITFQEFNGDCLNPVRERLVKSMGRIRSRGADYLAYAIIDAVIDGYFPVLEHFDRLLGGISDEIDEDLPHDIPKRLHHIRADLLSVRKVAQQHRHALNTLLRERSSLIEEDTLLFLRDCLDHITRLIEDADTYRETCGELRELYFAQLGQKTNDVMKVLTIIATIFIPMSFIAGVYGMNFDSDVSPLNMPELHWSLGYPFAVLLMACTGGGLVYYLKRKQWL